MSTRANIEFWTYYQNPKNGGYHKPVKDGLLYHHGDGYPEWMGPRLIKALEDAKKALIKAGYPYWWDAERVSAVIVSQDARLPQNVEYHGGIPSFQPCLKLHGDIEYLWRVYLGPKDGQYRIECYRVEMDWEKDKVKGLKKVRNWKAMAKEGRFWANP